MNRIPGSDFKRPFGVTLVSLLFLASSLLTLGVLVLGLVQPEWISSLHHVGEDIQSAGDHPAAWFLVTILYGAIAGGLWRLQSWARLAVLFVTGASLITAIAGITLATAIKPLTNRPIAGFFWFSAILSGVIVLYFRQDRVKLAFSKRGSHLGFHS